MPLREWLALWFGKTQDRIAPIELSAVSSEDGDYIAYIDDECQCEECECDNELPPEILDVLKTLHQQRGPVH